MFGLNKDNAHGQVTELVKQLSLRLALAMTRPTK